MKTAKHDIDTRTMAAADARRERENLIRGRRADPHMHVKKRAAYASVITYFDNRIKSLDILEAQQRADEEAQLANRMWLCIGLLMLAAVSISLFVLL